MLLENKVVIITGASSGIGIEIARKLAQNGLRLMLTARRQEKLETLQSELQATGAEVVIYPADITVEADCQQIVAKTLSAFGTIDILVNNAGYGPPCVPYLPETDEDLWDVTIDTCLKSVYLMTRAVLATMLDNNRGRIVQISSVAGKFGYGRRTAYCAAKWGVQGFTEALRSELGDKNIQLHTINPAAVATPWWETANDGQSDAVMAKMISPVQVAEAVTWIVAQPANVQINEVVMTNFRSPWSED